MHYLRNLFIFSLISLTVFGCGKAKAPPRPNGVAVNAITVEPQTIPAEFEYVGVAQSSHLVEIRARVEGYLEEIAYHEGALVHEGNLLFRIDPKPFEAAQANAKGMEEQAQAILWEAQRTLERLKPLYEQKAASRRDLDNAIAEEQRAKASLDSAKAQVQTAELNLGYTQIHSPITGVTSQAQFRVGALVGPGQNSLLATVTAVDPIWVNFNISERDLLKFHDEIQKGQLQYPPDMKFDVEVELANGKRFPSQGKIDFTDPTLQQSTGTMSVRAVFPNTNNLLIPGQFVRAIVKGGTRPNAIVVPQKALMQGKNGMFVYVVDKDDKAEVRSVETGDWYEKDWIIKSGLKAGDRVIVDGINKVMPGMTVIIQNQAEKAPQGS